jgi:hypothetical protein
MNGWARLRHSKMFWSVLHSSELNFVVALSPEEEARKQGLEGGVAIAQAASG